MGYEVGKLVRCIVGCLLVTVPKIGQIAWTINGIAFLNLTTNVD